MLILSAGMQKSGSAYFYNIINELLAKSGRGKDARIIKARWGLDTLLIERNNNIGIPTYPKLLKLWCISIINGTFAVKTHAAPTKAVKTMCKYGMLRVVYSYRDPRDVLLSAIDHGKKEREDGRREIFTDMLDFDIALKKISAWIKIWQMYSSLPNVLSIKYEEIMQNPIEITRRIETFLNAPLDDSKREEILWKFSKDNKAGDRRGMHFNKAKIFRHKTEMTEQQRAACEAVIKNDLIAMEYDI